MTSADGLLNPDVAAYQAVILMEDELPYEAAQKLLQWAKDGLPVVLVNNVSEIVANTDVTKDNTEAGSTTGSNDGNEEALAEIVKEMKELSNVKTVESESDAYEALQELGVSPRVEYKEANTKLLPVMRSAEDAAVDELHEKSSINNVLTLSNWNLTIDFYEPGEKVTRTEENEDTGVTTTEAAYTTNHVEIDVGNLTELISWKEIENVGETVSGIGTYTTTFELPDEWQIAENTEASESDTESASSESAKTNSGKIEFQADSFQGGTAAIWINGTKVPVNMDRHSADLTACIQPGENTITVRVTSSLCNIMITQGYDGWIFGTPDPDDYGMTGKTRLVYTK